MNFKDMEHRKQRSRGRREPAEDPFDKYEQDLFGVHGIAVLDSTPSSAPSPLVEVANVGIVPTHVETPVFGFFPTSLPAESVQTLLQRV